MSIKVFINNRKNKRRKILEVEKEERVFVLGQPVEDKTESIQEIVGFSTIDECLLVINANLASKSRHFRPKMDTRGTSEIRDRLLKELFDRNVQRVL